MAMFEMLLQVNLHRAAARARVCVCCSLGGPIY